MIDTADIDALQGASAVDRDGDRLGRVGQVYISEDGRQPLFVTVHTGLFGTNESFVPLEGADLQDGVLHLQYDKATIKDAPNIADDGALTDDEQGAIFDYYDGRSGGSASGTDGTPAGLVDDVAGRGDGSGAADLGATGTGAGAADLGATGAGTASDADTTGRHAEGRDTSGPTTDDAMTLSEEQVRVGTQRVETGRARLRKHVVTEQRTITVPVTHEEVRLEREPITDANRDAALDGPDLSDEEHEVVLTEERPVVQKETVPVERVRLTTDQVTEDQAVTTDVRHEEVETDGDATGASTASGATGDPDGAQRSQG